MSLFPGTNSTYFGKARREHSDSSQIPVKTEESPSPDLVQTSHPPAQDLRYPFSSQSSTSHASASVSNTEQPSQLLDHQSAAYSFSSNPTTSAYTLVPPVSTSQWTTAQMDSKYDLSLEGAMSFNDEYDDVGDLMDLQSMGGAGGGLGSMGGSDKPVRRRSSKACDQCRKSKCKCERSSPDEPCRSCVLLGTTCTFLGPSRKRGPPKGYIDAIEARLHQTEALLGIMISSADERAQSLLKDISQDPLAREIITRVDHSPYGVKGRKGGDEKTAGPSKSRHLTSDQRSQDKSELSSTHPSNEWQDKVVHMLSLMSSRNGLGRTQDTGAEQSSQGGRTGRQPATIVTAVPMARSVSHPHPEPGASSRHGSTSPGRRLRRRIDPAESSYPTHSSSAPPSATFPPVGFGFTSPGRAPYGQLSPPLRGSNSDFDKTSSQPTRSTSPALSYSSDSDTEDLSGAVGQLSLNEEEEVRYHGKASGLYLLHSTDRRDSRNEGGIWRFPKARVWPALQSGSPSINMEDEDTSALPALPVQERLLDLYFTHVHPSFPVLHKQAFLESFKAGAESPASLSDVDVSHSSPFTRRSRRIPHVLLLTMFSIAARYSPDTASPRPIDKSVMWEAGDDFLGQAKRILDTTYANSRPTTCQALLLLGYREIGIGAMAQAWIYTGMAIRMAQDLGMHRSADGWARQELGGRLFSQWELQSRRRIWYTCVVMDKYVSSYIGRPLSIFERDFDTLVPSEEESEELEEWISFTHDADEIPRRPSRIISCFNASASLSGIISMIIQAIYAVRPVSRRHGESVFLEGILDKWLVALPDHLQHDPGSAKYPVPLPHVLTLHMQYWCAVLLLHRPFMRLNSRHLVDGENRNSAQKAYELCVGAANHITSIATLYQSTYTLKGAAAFLCYYVFTASLMHVTSMSAHPGNPQAAFRLNKCVEILENMEILWPSAGRARQLLQGAEINTAPKTELPAPERFKRAAEHSLNDTSMDIAPSRVPPISNFSSRHSSYNHQPGANQLPSNMFGSDGIPMRYASGSQYPPFERQWSSDYPAGQNAYSVSTSPLPQMYSTGLALERRSSGSTAANPRFSQQYWNDYTAYTPGGYHAPPPPLQNNPSSQDPLHHMFMSDPYHVYSKPS